MVTRHNKLVSLVALCVLGATRLAAAQDQDQPKPKGSEPTVEVKPEPTKPEPVKPASLVVPRLHHAPVSSAEAHKMLTIRAEIDHPELVKRALLVYRFKDSDGFKEAEFQRASTGPYVAVLSQDQLEPPSFAYTIEIEPVSGPRIAAFASRERPHNVMVPEDLMDERERALLTRLGGRRSVFSGSGDFVSFGHSTAQGFNGGAPQTVQDQYYRIEAAYTYRPLRVVTEFSVRAGIVRGKSPVPVKSQAELAPGQSEADRFNVGLNYGAPTVRFRLHDQVHLEVEGVTSVTEQGFSWGGGGAVLLGDPYGSKLTLGFESIQVFGNRFWSRMDVVVTDRVIVAPVIEITNMPHADDYGERLYGEVAVDIGNGFGAALRGGYQARKANSGGPAAGATVFYAF